MSVNNKHRYWWFILYPESAIPDWKDVLKMRGLPIAISPLHEFDIKNQEGETKKPHHHVILCYSGPTTFKSVKSLTVDTLQATIPQPLDSVKGAYDYLTHKNDPDKYQYSDEEIELMNGFDIIDMVQLNERDKAELSFRVMDDIKEQNITEYSDLLEFYRNNEDYQLYNYVFGHTIPLNTYISSLRNKMKSEVR